MRILGDGIKDIYETGYEISLFKLYGWIIV